ncbi:hypothetical protein [Enterobacteriaceae endosymbiont of Plateumaris braccata]|uniref:hypothetical protein n=1 Tax=Enterobacteriaceae endosymbiont of Plateumaris braccata TaxID=2675793 RepID=UPI0014497917|nr:hypothetical protein GJT80_00930 [Enterobacteriaceae endosymbiont of Plateumaris braccata]
MSKYLLLIDDLFNKNLFIKKFLKVIDYYNFKPIYFYKSNSVNYKEILEEILDISKNFTKIFIDVNKYLYKTEKK